MNRRFLRSLHEQHLEEAAFLYERRRAMLDDVEVGVRDILGLEERIEAHLDALVVGGEPALQLCAQRAMDGEPGERFVAMALLCRQNRRDSIDAALPSFDEEPADEAPAEQEDDFAGLPGFEDLDAIERGPVDEDEESVDADEAAGAGSDAEPDADQPAKAPSADELTLGEALGDALRLETGPEWQPVFERVLAESAPVVRTAFAVAAAGRGLPVGPAIVAATKRADPAIPLGPLLWAMGRLREGSAATLLSEHARAVASEHAPIAMLALLRSGDANLVEHVARLAASHAWACSLLAIAGGPAHATVVQSRLARPQVTAAEIGAAGLFGDVAVVPRLLECLEQGVHPAAAAQALHLLTGAGVRETVIVEVPEPEPLANGEPDPRDRVEVGRLAEDAAKWREWWSARRSAFEPRRRYRLGQLASPTVLGQTLHHFVLHRPLRQLAADEIGLRYRPRRDVDVDMLVRTQHAALAELASIERTDPVVSHAEGAWVFARAPMR